MNKKELLSNLEEIMELDPETLLGEEMLEDFQSWDSLAIVTFIALLDMVKDGIIRIEQAERFLTIRIFLNKDEPVLVEEA